MACRVLLRQSRSPVSITGLLAFAAILAGMDPFTGAPRAQENNPPKKDEVELSETAKKGLVLVEVVRLDGTVAQHAVGVMIEKGILATNVSSIRRGERLLANWVDGSTIPAEGVLAFDRDLDVALVKLAVPSDVDVPVLKLRNAPTPGETFQFAGLTPMRDVVARPAAIIEKPEIPAPEDHLVCDAAAPNGCPGGAWFGVDGELLGLWTWSAREKSGESLGITSQILKNMLRRQQERVPLSLAELRKKMNTVGPSWGPLYPSRKLATSKGDAPRQNQGLRTDIRFIGPKPGDPFHLGDYRTQGGWKIVDRLLTAPADAAVSLRVATADAFTLEMEADASGEGGWFILFGADERNGYVLSNVTLRSSGSPWLLCELKDGACNPDRYQELGRTNWKGAQRFSISVGGNTRGEYRLEAALADKPIFDAKDLPNYVGGDIVVGTYNTRYGCKQVRIQSIRAKSR